MINKRVSLNIFAALTSGACLALAFAPVNWFFLAFISPAIILSLWLRNSARAAFWYGLLFGAGFFGVGASWVYISIHEYGNAGVFLASIITALFVLILALFIAVNGYVFSRLFHRQSLALKCLVIFPILWVILEWLRSWLFTGFPWLLLGYSQTLNSLKYLAPIFSVYGVSLATAFTAGALTYIFCAKKQMQRNCAFAAAILLNVLAWSLQFITWTKAFGAPVPVAIVQGNIALEMKWDNQYLQNILTIYSQQTQQHWNKGIIVWPEAAIPAYPEQVSDYLTNLNALAKKNNTAIIYGIPTFNPENQNYYNSLRVIGDGSGVYNKRHLVPFGEYTPLGEIFQPLMNAFGIPMSGFTPGRYNQPLLTAKNLKFAPFICYEIAFPHEVLHFARNSNFLVVVSDDSWFGNSFASAQQYQMAQMRALETGRPILYSSNTGITAIINSNGTTQVAIKPNALLTLIANFQPVTGNTPVMW